MKVSVVLFYLVFILGILISAYRDWWGIVIFFGVLMAVAKTGL